MERAAAVDFRIGDARRVVAKTIYSMRDARRFDRAEYWTRKWLALLRSRSDSDPKVIAMDVVGLGSMLVRQRKSTEGEAVLRESLSMFQKHQADPSKTCNAQSLLGGALLGQKRYAEAEPHIVGGWEGPKAREKSIPSESSSVVPNAIFRLVLLYEATGRKVEAAKRRKEMETFQRKSAACDCG